MVLRFNVPLQNMTQEFHNSPSHLMGIYSLALPFPKKYSIQIWSRQLSCSIEHAIREKRSVLELIARFSR